MIQYSRCPIAAIVLAIIFVPSAWSAPTGTVMVEMRDGTRLATDYYLPSTGGPSFPVVLVRSTYGRGGDSDAGRYTDQGYAYVVQDVRGRGDSEGTDNGFHADGWGPEYRDGADTVEWVKTQAWCNGKIATAGGSALGITQVLMAPATQSITCQYIDAAASTFYGNLAYQGGVFRKSLCEGWLQLQGISHVIDIWHSHPTYDEFWAYYDAEAKAADITAPALHVGGWYDIFAQGAVNSFVTRQYNGGPGAKGSQKLIMKWSGHGPDITPDFTFNENRFDVHVSWVRNDFFEYWLKGIDNGIMNEPAVTYYVLGDDTDPNAPGMEWRTANKWPPFPPNETLYYLNPDGTLSTEVPDISASGVTFTYVPADPFPTRGGQNLLVPWGPYDQRAVNDGRTDLLKFATSTLAEPVEITGAVRVRLYVSSTAADTDFTAKLVDIFPSGDGREILLLDNIRRVKYRQGFESPDPLPVGDIGEMEIDLWNTSWIFNTGHRIGLQISSSNYPRFEKNPNTGEDLPDAGSLEIAHNTVHMGEGYRSALILPVRKPTLDSDGDGLTDEEEWDIDTRLDDPDTDGDSMPDGWEVTHGLDPRDASDASEDADNDGWTNLEEYQGGSDPQDENSVPGTYTISGTVTLRHGAAPVTDVTLELSGDAAETTNPGADGSYSFTDLTGGEYTIAPSLQGYVFEPGSISYAPLASDQTGQDFTGRSHHHDSDGTCVITSTACGTPLTDAFRVLHEFRDRYLLTNRAGTACVRTYYRLNPALARFSANRDHVRGLLRGGLTVLVAIVRLTCAHPAASGSASLVVLSTVGLSAWALMSRKKTYPIPR